MENIILELTTEDITEIMLSLTESLADDLVDKIKEQVKEQAWDKGDITGRMWDDFRVLQKLYRYYEDAYKKMTTPPLPPCFDPKVEPKYIKYIQDSIYQLMLSIEAAYKNIDERMTRDGE